MFTVLVFAAAGLLSLTVPVDVPWFSYSAFGAAIVLMTDGWNWPDAVACVAFTAVMGSVRAAVDHRSLDLTASLVHAGVAALAILFVKAALADGPRKARRRSALLIAASVPAFAIGAAVANLVVARLCPTTYDLRLFHIDASLGFEPSFVAGRLLQHLPTARSLAAFFYLALPVGMMLTYSLMSVRPTGFGWLMQLGIAGVLGAFVYWLVPAVGPLVAFPNYPQSPHDAVGSEVVQFAATRPRNCVPSLHFGWALLMLLNARGALSRLVASLFLVFMVVGTLGFGEHYLIDLVIAVPFAVGIRCWFLGRWPAALACATLVAVWPVAILKDWGPTGVAPSWIAVLATLTIPFVFYSRAGSRSQGRVLAADCR